MADLTANPTVVNPSHEGQETTVMIMDTTTTITTKRPLTKYIFSMDHKMILKQFLITGIFWVLLEGLCRFFSDCSLHG